MPDDSYHSFDDYLDRDDYVCASTAQASYNGEEIFVTFQGTIEESDYGVPGSPMIKTVEDVDVIYLEILGSEVGFEILPPALQDKIIQLADEINWDT